MTLSGNDNYIKLYKFHISLFTITFILYVLMLWWVKDYLTDSGKIGVLLVYGLPSLLHLLLAWGCKQRKLWARKLSVFIGAPMLLFFPIGTVVEFYYLPLTNWENQNV